MSLARRFPIGLAPLVLGDETFAMCCRKMDSQFRRVPSRPVQIHIRVEDLLSQDGDRGIVGLGRTIDRIVVGDLHGISNGFVPLL